MADIETGRDLKRAMQGGYPRHAALSAIYDELDYQRACQVYIWATPAVGMEAVSSGLAEAGLPPDSVDTVGIFENFLDAKTVVATGNGQSIYAIGNIDLSATGPVVIEAPAGVIGFIMSGWQQPVEDVGLLGPDKGEGGAFTLLPPGFTGDAPAGPFTLRPDTMLVNWCFRGFVQDGKPDAAVQSLKGMRVYPLGQEPTPMNFVNLSGKQVAMIALNDTLDTLNYFKLVAKFIEREPTREQDKQFLGLARMLGITKGHEFAPDERMQRILARAARVGHAMVAAIAYEDRAGDRLRWPGESYWEEVVTTSGNMDYVEANFADIDGRAALYYQAAGASKSINLETIGAGSKYAALFKDASGAFLDGSRDYVLRVPAEVPAKNFWSVVAYDAVTRSMIDVDPPISGRDSYQETLTRNDDGSVDIYFGPTPPQGHEDNWVPTKPDVGFFLYFRWYGPLEHYYDKTWSLPDVEPLGTQPLRRNV
jgi:hypothetical protein